MSAVHWRHHPMPRDVLMRQLRASIAEHDAPPPDPAELLRQVTSAAVEALDRQRRANLAEAQRLTQGARDLAAQIDRIKKLGEKQ